MWNEPTPEELAGLPKLKGTENVPLEQKLVHVHFFLGGSDWYGVEYDPAQRLFLGYAVLNNDLESAEWGHFSFDELRDAKVRGLEIDYDIDWNVRPAREVEKIRQGMRWTQPPQDRSDMNAERPEMTVRLSTKDWYVTQVGRSASSCHSVCNRALSSHSGLS